MKKAVEVFAAGLSAFAAKGEAGQPGRFSKEVLHLGSFVHPLSGESLEFLGDRDFLERLARNTNQYIALGNKVTFPVGADCHDTDANDARQNLGFWSNFRMLGSKLVADVDVLDGEIVGKIGKTIQDVSAGIYWNVLSSTGETFEAVIRHVAATPYPVVPGQENFTRLAAALGESLSAVKEIIRMANPADEKKKKPQPDAAAADAKPGADKPPADKPANDAVAPEKSAAPDGTPGKPGADPNAAADNVPGAQNDKQPCQRGADQGGGAAAGQPGDGVPADAASLLARACEMLGLAKGCDASTFLKTLSDALASDSELIADGTGAPMGLSAASAKKEINTVTVESKPDAKDAKVKELEAKLAAVEKESADREIAAVREHSAKTGSPLTKDAEDDARALFAEGKKDMARRILSRATSGTGSAAESVTALASPGQREKEDQAAERDGAIERGLLSQGIQPEKDSKGRLKRDARGDVVAKPVSAPK